MNHKALVVIDIQNDITKHYRDIIDRLNAAIEWAAESGVEIVYIQHNNLSAGTRTFKPGTKGTELVSEALTENVLSVRLRLFLINRLRFCEGNQNDSYCTKEWLTQENDKIINGFVQAGEQVVIIDDDYESEIGNGF